VVGGGGHDSSDSVLILWGLDTGRSMTSRLSSPFLTDSGSWDHEIITCHSYIPHCSAKEVCKCSNEPRENKLLSAAIAPVSRGGSHVAGVKVESYSECRVIVTEPIRFR
jgi:hypothetical protein